MTKLYEARDIIKDRVTPDQVIEYYTGQRPRGKRYICPFHNDHDPSLSVKGKIWNCFACHQRGDVISFVQDYFKIGFAEALQKLNEDFCLGISFPSAAETDRLEKLWLQVGDEVRNHNRKECQKVFDDLDAEIDKLIICRRVLYQRGASEDTLRQYDEEIDGLIYYRGELKGDKYPYRLRMTAEEIRELAVEEEKMRQERRQKQKAGCST